MGRKKRRPARKPRVPHVRRIKLGPKMFLVKIGPYWYIEKNGRRGQVRRSLKETDLREAVKKAVGLVSFCVACGRRFPARKGKRYER